MSYLQNLMLFWVLILGIVAVPGMDMLLVLTNALARGQRAGMASVAGITTAGVVHTLWGTLGVALLLVLPAPLFSVLLVAGALYLGWIGVTLLRSTIVVSGVDAATAVPARVAFRQGAVTGLLNPKAYVFVLSVYPHVIRPEYGHIAMQGLVAGALTALTQVAVYGGVALAAGRVRRWLLASPRATILTGRITGAAFLGIAALTLAQALPG